MCGFRASGSDVPFCPAGGMHFPQAINRDYKDLRVATSGPGEAGWRRCDTCTSLFWEKGAERGKCVDGPHTPVAGASYVVDQRTK